MIDKVTNQLVLFDLINFVVENWYVWIFREGFFKKSINSLILYFFPFFLLSFVFIRFFVVCLCTSLFVFIIKFDAVCLTDFVYVCVLWPLFASLSSSTFFFPWVLFPIHLALKGISDVIDYEKSLLWDMFKSKTTLWNMCLLKFLWKSSPLSFILLCNCSSSFLVCIANFPLITVLIFFHVILLSRFAYYALFPHIQILT